MHVRKARPWLVGLTALMLAVVACTCGPLSDLTQGLDEAQTEMEAIAEVAATSAVQYSTAASADVQDDQGGAASGDLPTYDGDDGYDTEFVDYVGLDTTVSATFTDVFLAQNWVFDGQAGMTVQIVVSGGSEETDTRAQLIDPVGNVLAVEDDTNGVDPFIEATLPGDGMYTVRMDSWDEGSYTLIVSTGQ